MGDCFYRSKDPTNSIKVLKEKAENKGLTRGVTVVSEGCIVGSFV